jgi:hypothetical protein
MAVTFAGNRVMVRILQQGTHQRREFRAHWTGITSRRAVLLNYFFTPKNRILGRLGDAEFQHGFGGNLDLLFR